MHKKPVLLLILLFGLSMACSLGASERPTETRTGPDLQDEITPDPVTPTISEDITPTICPQATPEWLRVLPVTSPTGDLTQTIYIDINNGESVTVTTPASEFEARQESGTLEDLAFRYNFIAEIDLLPNTEQELTVQTRIRQIEQGGCPYGGYPLTTKVDINFEPLVIIQESE